jgi:peptidyl-dipeptidase A
MRVEQIFRTAEEFFVSLGLEPMPETFWNDSVFTKPFDKRDMNCHPSAWDFYNGKDFRLDFRKKKTKQIAAFLISFIRF